MRSSKMARVARLWVLLTLMLGLVMPATAQEPATPEVEPTVEPTATTAPEPTTAPQPTAEPTTPLDPTVIVEPTMVPTDAPIEVPTETPTESPTETPTPEPTTEGVNARSFNILAADPATIVLDGPTSIAPGETLTYTVTLTNTSGGTLNYMSVDAHLPGTWSTWEITSHTFTSCGVDTGSFDIDCFSFDVPNSFALTVTYQSTIPATPSADLCANGFSHQAAGVGAAPFNLIAYSNTVTTDVVCDTASIDLTKEGFYVPSTPGSWYGRIDWVLTVTNPNASTLTDVAVTDEDVTDLDCDPAADGNQATIASLAPGDANAVTCTATSVMAEDQPGTTVTNDASVSATSPSGGQPVTDTARAQVVVPAATFTMVLDGPTSIAPGEALIYTLTMTITGGDTPDTVIVEALLPPDTGSALRITSQTFTDCVILGARKINCRSHNVPVGTVLTVTYQNTIPETPTPDICANGVSYRAYGLRWDGGVSTWGFSNTVTTDVVCGTASIELGKSGAYVPSTAAVPYGAIDWNLAVTNTGDVPLTDVAVTDAGVTDLDCDPATDGNQPTIASLAPGDANAVTCTATSVMAEDQLGTTVTNNASVSTTSSGQPVMDETSAQVAVPALTTGMLVTKTVTNQPVDGFDLGETVTYGITVTNTGSIPLFGVVVSDPQVTNVDCGTGTTGATVTLTRLDPGEANAVDCTASMKIPAPSAAAPGPPQFMEISNTVTVTAPLPGDDLVETATAQARLASWGFDAGPGKVWEPVAAPGVITRPWNLENVGDLTLIGISLTTPIPIDCDLATPGNQSIPESLAPGMRVDCHMFFTVTQADIDAGDPLPVSLDLYVYWELVHSLDASLEIDQHPAMTLTKTVDPALIDAPGDVTWSFAIANTGNVTLTNLALDDSLIDPATIDCDPGMDGLQGFPASLAPEASLTCTAVTAIDQGMLDAREPLTNTASVTSDQVTSNSSTARVTITPRDGLGLSLTVTPSTVDAPGNVTWTYAITNSGTSTLTSLAIDDPALDLAMLDCDAAADGLQPLPTTLGAAGVVTCTVTEVVDQADIDAGDPTTRDARATSAEADSNQSRATVSIVQRPSIGLTKSVDPVLVDAPGNVTWSFAVTNTGNVTLTGLALDDDLIDPATVDCDPADGLQPLPASLAPTDSVTCTAVTAIDQDMVDARQPLINIATITSDQVTSNSSTATVTITPRDGLGLVLTVAPSTTDAPGSVTWTYAISNGGTGTLTNLAIDDSSLDLAALDCDAATEGVQSPPTSLAPGGSVTCTETSSVDQGDLDAGNPITRNAVVTSAEVDSNQSRATLSIVRRPSLTLTKTVDPVAVETTGDVTWTFVVTNTGNVTLTNLALVDSLVDPATLDCDVADGIQPPPTSLAPTDAVTCTAVTTISQGQIDARQPLTNTASVTSDHATSNEASATVTITPRDGLGLVLTVDPGTMDAPGAVTWTYALTNGGTSTLTGLTIDDPALDPAALDCDPDTGDLQPLPTSLAPGDGVTCTAAEAVDQSHLDAGDPITREATATSTQATSSASRATVNIIQAPGIGLTKTVTSDATSGLVTGDVVTYELVLTNTGNQTVTDLSITDPASDTLDCGEIPATLAPGETVTCTATHAITETDMLRGSYTNTAAASATVGTGQANGVLSFRQVETLVVETTAAATVTTAPVTVGLTIEKTVSPADPARAGTTLTYTFVVTNTGNVSLDDVTVGDPLPGLVWDADHSDGRIGTLGAGEAVTLTATYVVTVEDVTAGEVTNAAAVSGVHPSCRAEDDIPSVEECAVTTETASVAVPAEPEPTSPPESTPVTSDAPVVTTLPTTGGGPDAGVPGPSALLGLLGLAIAALAVRAGIRQAR